MMGDTTIGDPDEREIPTIGDPDVMCVTHNWGK
jgi:hypothetical protein